MLNYIQAQKQVEELEKSGKWSQLPSDDAIEKAAKALTENGFEVEVVDSSEEAKRKVLKLIPEGAEVMTMTSRTLDSIGVTNIFNESGKYNSVKVKLTRMDRNTQEVEMLKAGAAAEYAIGSVHAVTQDGHVMIASNSGSQIPGYSYGSKNVIWVVGAQKIVKDREEGFQRINERCLPLEAIRAHEAYGVEGSNVSKVLIINREVKSGRVKLILVREILGF